MKNLLLILVLALGLATFDADAARRFGGGGNVGKQRATPTQTTKEAAPAPASPTQSAATPAKPAQAPAPAPQPQGFMGKWGGMIAGLGIGALLGSMFGGGLGGAFGGILLALLGAAAIFFLVRMFLSRGAPATKPMAYAGTGGTEPAPAAEVPAPAPLERGSLGIGSRVAGEPAPAPAAAGALSALPPGFEVAPFERVAKTSFIRLQAANDAGDLDDIRDFTTPELYAEIAMQIKDRGSEPQRTEVLNVEAKVIEAVVEDGYEIASVRFAGLIREAPGANPESFDEIWHVRRKAGDRKATWLIAGIQQAA